jgi:hypothetical protein
MKIWKALDAEWDEECCGAYSSGGGNVCARIVPFRECARQRTLKVAQTEVPAFHKVVSLSTSRKERVVGG